MASPAEAACTSPVDSETTCNGGNGAEICQDVTGGIWECDTARTANTAPARAYIILDVNGDFCTAGNYCAFGLDASGDGFCCEHSPVTPITVYEIQLRGGVSGDTLAFQYTLGTVDYQLENGSTSVAIQAWMYGDAGNDEMVGSDYDNFRYHESFAGDDEVDVIHGHRGLVVDSERALFCAGGVLWNVTLADGVATETATPCASVGGGDATVLLSPRGGQSAYHSTAEGAASGATAESAPFLRRNGSVSVNGDSAAVTALPGMAVFFYSISTGDLTATLVPEGLTGTVWGLSWAGAWLYLLDNGVTEEERLSPSIRWYDPATGKAVGSLSLSLQPGEQVRGLSCSES